MVQRPGKQVQITRTGLGLGSPVAGNLAAHTLGGSRSLPTHQQVPISSLLYNHTMDKLSFLDSDRYSRSGC